MLKEMILEGKLHDLEARRAIAYMPFYLRLPSEKLLSSYEELLKENPKIQSKYGLIHFQKQFSWELINLC